MKQWCLFHYSKNYGSLTCNQVKSCSKHIISHMSFLGQFLPLSRYKKTKWSLLLSSHVLKIKFVVRFSIILKCQITEFHTFTSWFADRIIPYRNVGWESEANLLKICKQKNVPSVCCYLLFFLNFEIEQLIMWSCFFVTSWLKVLYFFVDLNLDVIQVSCCKIFHSVSISWICLKHSWNFNIALFVVNKNVDDTDIILFLSILHSVFLWAMDGKINDWLI